MITTIDARTAAEIDNAAEQRFHDFFRRRNKTPSVPVPLESLLRFDLGLRLAFLDISNVFGDIESLGFLCIPYEVVMIDDSLHPTEHPEMFGRYRFTVAHEIAHWCLHRRDLDVALGWARRDPARELMREKQANRFAGALMMPKELLRPAWRARFGARALCRNDLLPSRTRLIDEEIRRRQYQPETAEEMDRMMFEGAVSGLAEQFGVSPWAMRIRCEQIGLIVR